MTTNKFLQGHEGGTYACVFSSNGRHIFTGGADRSIRLWRNPYRDANETQLHKPLIAEFNKGHGYSVSGIAVAKGNAHFASCGGDRSGPVLWDIGTQTVLRKFHGHEQAVSAVAFMEIPDQHAGNSTSSSGILVSGSHDKTVCIWDCLSSSHRPVQVLGGLSSYDTWFRGAVSDIAIVGEYQIAASCADQSVTIFDIRRGLANRFDLALQMADRKDGNSTSSNTVKVAAAIGKDPLHGATPSRVAASNDMQCLLVSYVGGGGGSIHLLDKETGQVLKTFQGHQNDTYSIQACLDNTDGNVVSGSEDGYLHVWDLISARIVHRVCTSEPQSPLSPVATLSYHPSLPIVASAGASGKICVTYFGGS